MANCSKGENVTHIIEPTRYCAHELRLYLSAAVSVQCWRESIRPFMRIAEIVRRGMEPWLGDHVRGARMIIFSEHQV